jgi:hypothetical protein
MGLLGDRTVVAIDASGLAGTALPGRLRSAEARTERVPLEPGALVPSPVEPNLVQPAVVKAALTSLVERLGRPSRITLVLPLGVARFSLVSPPAGTAARDFARFRLAPTLPFPGSEAIVDVVPAGRGLALAAAVRRQVVSGYEELFATAGPELERVDLMPLPAVAVRGPGQSASAAFVFLGDTAFAVALYEEGTLQAFHMRWRAAQGPADIDRIARVAASTAAGHRGAVTPRVLVLGNGSDDVATGLLGRGIAASAGPATALLGAAA